MTINTKEPPNPPIRISSECVSDGHPDKICDQIADAVLDACLAQDPESRAGVEAAFKDHDVFVFGEVTTRARLDIPAIARQVLVEIGHGDGRWGLDLDRLEVHVRLTEQAPEIRRAVGPPTVRGNRLGAGDQGIVYGYACDETPELMPLSYALARALMLRHREVRNTKEGSILGPDAKSLVTVGYDGGQPVDVQAVVLSSQHASDAPLERVRELLIEEVVRRVIPEALCHRGTRFFINPGGPFTGGGPIADAGLTGRKIMADTYGTRLPHGGGAFSGKDGTKVDRSGAYAARRLARCFVEAGIATTALVTAVYAIGDPRPVFTNLEVTCFPGDRTQRWLDRYEDRAADLLSPVEMMWDLRLTEPIFRQVAAFGHFGRTDIRLPWEEPLDLLGEKERSASQ